MIAKKLSLSAIGRAVFEQARSLRGARPVVVGNPPAVVLALEHREAEAPRDVEPSLHGDAVKHPAGGVVRGSRIEKIAAVAGHDLDREVRLIFEDLKQMV